MTITTPYPADAAGMLACDTERAALFLDFDGTLVDIAERPDLVRVVPGLVDLLIGLRRRYQGAVAIVSGRSIASIDHFLSPASFDVAGLHGEEIRLEGRMLARAVASTTLLAAREELRRRISEMPGVLMEDKVGTIAMHWRAAPQFEPRAIGAIAETVAALGPGYRVQHGKNVAEIVRAGIDKGVAVRLLLDQMPFSGRAPVVLGDDLTDEAAFAAAADHGGFGIKVGEGATIAPYRLTGPAAVHALLRDLCNGERPKLANGKEVDGA